MKHTNYIRNIMQECPSASAAARKYVTFIVWLVTTLANLAWSTISTMYHASLVAMTITPGCNSFNLD